MYTFIIEGKPLRKRAHKTTRYGGVIDPDRIIKEQLSDYISENYTLPTIPLSGALKIELVAYFNVPKSISKADKKERLEQVWANDIRMDMDNVVKLYADVLQYGVLDGKIFGDDHQFCHYVLKKQWTEGLERVTIKIEPIQTGETK